MKPWCPRQVKMQNLGYIKDTKKTNKTRTYTASLVAFFRGPRKTDPGPTFRHISNKLIDR